jgi:riboflavin synthase
MFTGLIEGIGRVDRSGAAGAAGDLRIATPLGSELRAGDSIAVSGVCLTATSADAAGFTANVSRETLRVTTLGGLAEGQIVNLERPLRADARVGGHFVQGHVDGVGRIARLSRDGDCYWLDVDVPADLLPAVVSKGSIAIDGISLTVAALAGSCVGVQIVPFTFSATTFSAAQAGDAVNIETDVIGKYIARWLESRADAGSVRPAEVEKP